MLTLTDAAATEIRSIVAHPALPDAAGVRIAGDTDGGLTMTAVDGPEGTDAVLDTGGARVFLDQQADDLLSDKVLDAGADQQGNLQFLVGEQEQ